MSGESSLIVKHNILSNVWNCSRNHSNLYQSTSCCLSLIAFQVELQVNCSEGESKHLTEPSCCNLTWNRPARMATRSPDLEGVKFHWPSFQTSETLATMNSQHHKLLYDHISAATPHLDANCPPTEKYFLTFLLHVLSRVKHDPLASSSFSNPMNSPAVI